MTAQFVRLGVSMPPLKARILDAIRDAGPDGISTYVLHDAIYAGHLDRARSTIRTHVQGINAALEETDWVIVCQGRSYNSRWQLCKVERKTT